VTDTLLSSATKEVVIGFERPFVIIGERINPTGRKKLAEEMAAGNFDTVIADAIAQVEAGAQALDRARMKLPLLGDILLKFRLAQFSRTLGTLLTGGIPLVPSLEVSAGAMESPALKRIIETAAVRVSEGQSLNTALAGTGIIPDLISEMIEVGESTGALPQMLVSVAEFYEEELNTKLARLLALVEPLLLVVMGATILVILVALYLPIFSIGSAVR